MALVGHAGAGKSALLRLLAEGSTWLRGEELQQVSRLSPAHLRRFPIPSSWRVYRGLAADGALLVAVSCAAHRNL